MELRSRRVYGTPLTLSHLPVEELLVVIRNHLVATEENQDVLDMVEATLLVMEAQYIQTQAEDDDTYSRAIAQDAVARAPSLKRIHRLVHDSRRVVADFSGSFFSYQYGFTSWGHERRIIEVGEERYQAERAAVRRSNRRILCSSDVLRCLDGLVSLLYGTQGSRNLMMRLEIKLVGNIRGV